MLKKFNVREWFLSLKYWSLLLIPHLSIIVIFLFYILMGVSIIQEIECDESETSSLIKNIQRERERLLIKIIEKRQTFDLQQYTKYVYKHIREYEKEIKKQIHYQDQLSWNFSRALFFITTTLTTMGSNELIPRTTSGKLFLMAYTGFGIPLTLAILTDLSYLIKRLIKSITSVIYCIYLSNYFARIRRLRLVRFIEKQLNILLLYDNEDEEEEDDNEEDIIKYNNSFRSSSISQRNKQKLLNQTRPIHHEYNLKLTQLILILFIYIIFGTYFIPSMTFFNKFYLCFTTLFTINLNREFNQDINLTFITIYLFFGLAIALLCIRSLKIEIEKLLRNIGRKLLENITNFTKQIGLHDLNTDDLLAASESNFYPLTDPLSARYQYLIRTRPSDSQIAARPIGIAEPLRRFSSGILRTFKSSDSIDQKTSDKIVQVSTIIRRCGRCADSVLPIQPVRKFNAMSTSSSSMTDCSSSCDDDDIREFAPPNMDRVRHRRATLVAKTILHQMTTQQRSSINELVPPATFLTSRTRRTAADVSPMSVQYTVKVSKSLSPEISHKEDDNEMEFSEISKQISALLTPSDDEN